MKPNLLALICLGVLCTTLTLGLWPFHSPRNAVDWLGDHNGLRFGRYSTVIGSGDFQLKGPPRSPEASVEIWLQPRSIWGSGTFLAFYRFENLSQFSLRQSQTDLLLKTATQDDPPRVKKAEFHVDDVFRNGRPVFLTVTSGGQGASVYMDGALVATRPRFPLSAREFSGRLVLGDSPGQTDSWSGQMLGLALYHRQLTAIQVLHHYSSWKQNGRPEVASDERNRALYLFDECTGHLVHDKAQSGVDLYIPERYRVMDKIVLEPFWTEFEMSLSYSKAALKNIVGFIPFGFCFYACLLTVLSSRRAAIVTVVLGTAVSFTIEALQAFLPTRDSGTTDLIMNTLGTWVGVEFYHLLGPILVRFFPQLPFHVSPPE